MHTTDTPQGFRQSGTGLIVPETLARAREVWPRDEWKLLDRAAKMLAHHQVKFTLRCANPECDGTLSRIDDPELTLRCQCMDRILTRT